MDRYDVLVVGAGLAGLQAARMLARQDWRVMLMDRKRQVSQSVHTTGIFVRRTFEEFAFPPECLGPAVRRVRLISPSHRELSLESSFDEFRIAKMGRLYDRMLSEVGKWGGHWSPETTFETAERTSDGSVVTVTRGGCVETIFARYIVAADGVESRVALALGLSRNREWIVGVEDVYVDARIEGPPCLYCFLDPQLAPGYIGWIAHDGEETHLGVGGYADRFEPRRALARFLGEVNDYVDLSRATMVERRGGRIPVGGILSHIIDDHGLLVGDAAGAVSPLTAGGLDPCLRQSTLAASVVASYLATGDARELAPYRGPVFQRKFRARRWLRRALSLVRTRWAAEAMVAMLRMFPGRLIASRVFFGQGSFPCESLPLLVRARPESCV